MTKRSISSRLRLAAEDTDEGFDSFCDAWEPEELRHLLMLAASYIEHLEAKLDSTEEKSK